MPLLPASSFKLRPAIDFSSNAAFLWSAADLLRGDYKQFDYGKVILPFTVLRRLDCVLEAPKPAVLQGDGAQIKPNLPAYGSAFPENVRDVFERFDFPAMVEKLDGANLLFQIVQKFAAVDPHPDSDLPALL